MSTPATDALIQGRRSFADRLTAIALLGMALFWPVAWVSIDWATLVGLYEESVGFRYFYALRAVHEPQNFLFLAQGHLVTFTHELLQVLLDQFLPSEQLLPRVDIFVRLAIVAGHGMTLCAFAWAFHPNIYDGLRIPLAGVWALLYYVDGWDGYYVLLNVDYHTWIPAAGLLFVGVMTRLATTKTTFPYSIYGLLGLMAGIVVSIKLTLGALAVVAGIYLLLAVRPFSAARRGLLCAILLSQAIVIATIASSYWGRVEHVPRYVLSLAYFMVSALPIDVVTPDRLKSYIAAGRMFGFVAVVTLPLVLLALLFKVRNHTDRALAIAMLSGACIYVYFIAQRFTPVTFLEAGVYWLAAFSLSVAFFSRRLPWIRLLPLAVVALVTVMGISWNHPLSATIANLHSNQKAQDSLSGVLAGVKGRVGFLIPSNSYQFMSLEGALFKGTSDLASRQDYEKSPLSKTLVKNREFLFGDRASYRSKPPDPSEFEAVVFSVLYTDEAEGKRVEGLHARRVALEDHYNMSLRSFNCGEWVDFGEAARRLAVVCRRQPNH